MKSVIILSILAFIPSLHAEEFTTNRHLTARERLKPGEARARINAYMGGLVVREDSGKGWITFVNDQKILPAKEFNDFVSFLSQNLKLRMKTSNQHVDADLCKIFAAAKETGANAVVFVTDNDMFPMSLIAPDSGWAVVNVRLLARDIPQKIAQERIKKSILRSFAHVCGVADTGTYGSILWPVSKPEDLDSVQLPHMLPPTFVAPIGNHMVRAGMLPLQITSYRKAVTEGWAKPPTNNMQRAVWDHVKHPESRWDADFGMGVKDTPTPRK